MSWGGEIHDFNDVYSLAMVRFVQVGEQSELERLSWVREFAVGAFVDYSCWKCARWCKVLALVEASHPAVTFRVLSWWGWFGVGRDELFEEAVSGGVVRGGERWRCREEGGY